MSDANRHLKLRNTRQSDDQYVADSDDSVSTHSDVHSGEERVAAAAVAVNFEPDDDDVARAAADRNSRAYDSQVDVAPVATSSSSSGGDDDDENECGNAISGLQRVQYCGPDRLFYTPDTDGHRHLDEAEKAGMPYILLKDGANDDDGCDDEDDDDDENSDSGGGQFGYSCRRSAGSHRPGYGFASNGYVEDILAPARGQGASDAMSTSAAGGSGSDKRRQKSGSPPEATGTAAAAKNAAADRSSNAKRHQQQQQPRQIFYCNAADPESNEPNTEPVHYDDAFGIVGGQSAGKAKKGGKRREQGVRQTIKAQDVAGNRGQDDIDSLLDFIESNPSARNKRGVARSSGQLLTLHPQQPQLQQPKQKKPKDARAHSIGSTVAVEEAQQQSTSPLSPLAAAAPAPEIAQPEQPPPSLQQPVLADVPEQPQIPDRRPASRATLPSAGAVLNGGGGSSEEAAHEPQKPAQIIFTDFDILTAPEPAREVAFSVVLSKKERKHKRRQADPQPPLSSHNQPQHPASHNAQQQPQHYHQQPQLLQHRQAFSAPPRVHNGGGHIASVSPHAVAPSAATVSGSVAAARTSSSSRSDSPTASEASGSAQGRPRPLNPAQYEQLLRQKAQENALLRRDLDSCSLNHSQLISFLYSLC